MKIRLCFMFSELARGFFALSLAAEILFGLTAVAPAQTPPTPTGFSTKQEVLWTRFWNEYPAASKKIEAFYNEICFDETLIPLDGDEKARAETRWLSNGHKLRFDTHFASTGADVVRLANRFKQFRLEKRGETYSLVKVSGGLSSPDGLNSLRLNVALPFACYCIFEMTIIDFLKQPGAQIIGLATTSDPSQPGELLRIDWEAPNLAEPASNRKTRAGWFTFDPGRAWILVNSGFSYDKQVDAAKLGFFSYEGGARGIPLVQNLQYSKRKNGVISPYQRIEVSNVKLRPAASNLFKLSSFGIPDSFDDDRDEKSYTAYILVGLGLMGLLLSYYFYSRRKS